MSQQYQKQKVKWINEGRKQTLEEVEKMIERFEMFIRDCVDLEDKDKEYHLIINKIDKLKSEIKSLGEGK